MAAAWLGAMLLELAVVQPRAERFLCDAQRSWPELRARLPGGVLAVRKAHRSEPGLVERFEAFACGMEISNAFSELNDPDEQRARFEAQARLQLEGDEEAQPFDEAFLQALEHGMPPTGGLGLGIDRLVMVLSGRRSIREVVLFPAMRE